MRIDSVILIGLDDGGAGGGSSMVGDQLACSVIDPHKAQLDSDCDGADDELCDDSGDSADDACHVSVSPLSRDMASVVDAGGSGGPGGSSGAGLPPARAACRL